MESVAICYPRLPPRIHRKSPTFPFFFDPSDFFVLLDLGSIRRLWDFPTVLHIPDEISFHKYERKLGVDDFDNRNNLARAQLRSAATGDDLLQSASAVDQARDGD